MLISQQNKSSHCVCARSCPRGSEKNVLLCTALPIIVPGVFRLLTLDSWGFFFSDVDPILQVQTGLLSEQAVKRQRMIGR